MFTANGVPIGGIVPPDHGNGAPPHWLPHITVPDVDATVKQATSLGGRTVPAPSDIPSIGRYAVLADAQGAVFAVFAPSNPPGAENDPAIGEFSWHELVTSDWSSAFTFCQAFFVWDKQAEHDMGPIGIYLLFARNGRELGGMFTPGTIPP